MVKVMGIHQFVRTHNYTLISVYYIIYFLLNTKKNQIRAVDKQEHLTWFYFQGATVNFNIKPFGSCITEVFKHAVHCFCDIIRYGLVQFHPAVYHNTSIPEVKNFQLLKSRQVGLQIWQKLWRMRGKAYSFLRSSYFSI